MDPASAISDRLWQRKISSTKYCLGYETGKMVRSQSGLRHRSWRLVALDGRCYELEHDVRRLSLDEPQTKLFSGDRFVSYNLVRNQRQLRSLSRCRQCSCRLHAFG